MTDLRVVRCHRDGCDTEKSQPTNRSANSRYACAIYKTVIQLIAIGGAIGTGSFMIGKRSVSPTVDHFAYMIIGFGKLFRMRADGELLPESGI